MGWGGSAPPYQLYWSAHKREYYLHSVGEDSLSLKAVVPAYLPPRLLLFRAPKHPSLG